MMDHDEGEGGRLKLTSEQLAESAFRVWLSLTNGPSVDGSAGWVGQPPTLDLMPAATQESWLRLGQHSEALLAQLASRGGGSRAGVSYQEAAYHVMVLFLDKSERPAAQSAWAVAGEATRLAWEAVTRHLAMVLNSDELGSLEEAEAIWSEWASKKRTATMTRS